METCSMAVSMSSSDLAATRVFRIPELLSSIIVFLDNNNSALAACMLVNSVWAGEAVKILWKEGITRCQSVCKNNANSYRCGGLQIRDIAALASTPDRLQWYVNHIQRLNFYAEDWYDENKPWSIEGSSRLHRVFARVTFPRLKTLILGKTKFSCPDNEASLLLPYLQPNLRSFSISVYGDTNMGAILPDYLFTTLQHTCPALRILDIAFERTDSTRDEMVSGVCFNRFLKAMQSLTRLSIRDGFDDLLTSEGFTHITHYRLLTHLRLANIPEDWTPHTRRGEAWQDEILPSIKVLEAAVSNDRLNLLLPHLGKIVELNLRPFRQSDRVMAIIADARLASLEILQVKFGAGSIIRGADLVLTTEHAKGLKILKLPWDVDEYTDTFLPFTDGLTDEIMDRFARNLSQLTILRLRTRHITLSGASLISLGTHCKHLSNCHISADVCLETLVHDGCHALFPELNDLSLSLRSRHRRHYTDLAGTATGILLMAPKLDCLDFGFHHHPEAFDEDHDIDTLLHDLLVARNRLNQPFHNAITEPW